MDTHEVIYQTDTDLQMQTTNSELPKGKRKRAVGRDNLGCWD